MKGNDYVRRVVRLDFERSAEPDYFCKDGEIASHSGFTVKEGIATGGPATDEEDSLTLSDDYQPTGLRMLCCHEWHSSDAKHANIIYLATDDLSDTDAEGNTLTAGNIYWKGEDGKYHKLPVAADAGPWHDATACGIFLVALDIRGMMFYRWDSDAGAYAMLGRRLPAVTPDFSLKRTALAGYTDTADDFPTLTTPAGDEEEAALFDFTQQMIAEAADESLFTSPFLALCALRLHDGTYAMPSMPQLLIPNAGKVCAVRDALSSESVAVIHPHLRVCRLGIRLATNGSCTPWQDIVESVGIFVSEQAPLLDAMAKGQGLQSLPASDSNFSLSANSFGEEIVTPNLASRSQGYLLPCIESNRSAASLAGTSKFYRIASIPLSKISDYADFCDLTDISLPLPAAYALPSYTPDYFCHTDYRPAGCGAFHGRVNYWGGSAITPSPQQEFRLSPRFLFHPNPSCTRVKIKIDDASQSIAGLQRHTSLYGAFAINGYRPLPTTDEEAQESETISSAALLVTAQRDKPYTIERRDLCSVSHNSIIAVAPAFRTSLSRIYADGFLHLFTSGGIYLLGAPEDSAYTALGFLGAYNVAKRQGVATLPASVAFSSPAGIYEMSTGMPKPFGKGLRKLFDNEKEMREFLENATLHYHPTADLLIAESSGKIMACLEETWYKAKLAGAAAKSLAAATSVTTDTATFTTRPLKLGDPEELKRVAALYIRGNLDAERCRLQLSASNDLRTWTLLGSGLAPLGGWAGEGWRFFRAEVTMKIGDSPSALVFYLE